MKTILIAAMTKDRLIGRDGKIPWYEPDDLQHFKRTTMGHAVIMGRRTFESVGKSLTGRRNVVVTRNPTWVAQGADVVHSLADAINLCQDRGEHIAFVVGGAEIYKEALPIADEMILTRIPHEGLSGDTFFPEWNSREWTESRRTRAGNLDVVTYSRKCSE